MTERAIKSLKRSEIEGYLDLLSSEPDEVYVTLRGLDFSVLNEQIQNYVPGVNISSPPLELEMKRPDLDDRRDPAPVCYRINSPDRNLIKRILDHEEKIRKEKSVLDIYLNPLVHFHSAVWRWDKKDCLELTRRGLIVKFTPGKELPEEVKILIEEVPRNGLPLLYFS
ncbi:hypothetical protein HZA97_07090 [Candidatus Woesearchaeota archaeon]|nr:hypothetical protein [Candidatus Woesearchaeota archaeon]